MKQQTAVEWLLNEFQEAHKDFGGLDLQWLNKFEKAKEMEKEQITDAYIEGGRKGFNFFGDDYEQYYNETYTQSSE